MKILEDQLSLSATDLSSHLGCHHLTQFSVRVKKGELKRPYYDDPTLELLRQKGTEHEEAYLEYLRGQGLSLKEFPDHGPTTDDTLAAMREGHDVIFQAKLNQGRWTGRADFLLKTSGTSDLGDYHYEVVDTKLARETRAGTVLQLCLYAELVGQLQGRRPDHVMVVSPGKGFQPEVFRVDHYYAYYQLVKRRLEEAVEWGGVDPAA
ncbi:MAG: nuclease, partial [Gemmatimonadetes bacterium]|nr:nuclease [Gemmatimonadota bacterium]